MNVDRAGVFIILLIRCLPTNEMLADMYPGLATGYIGQLSTKKFVTTAADHIKDVFRFQK